MRLFVFLHVLSMFSAVGASYGPAFLVHRAAATRHVPTIRGVFSTAKAVGPLTPVFFLSGFAFALLAIFTEGFNPFRPWLLIAYVLFAIGMFTGFRIHAPYGRAVGAAAEASPDVIAPCRASSSFWTARSASVNRSISAATCSGRIA